MITSKLSGNLTKGAIPLVAGKQRCSQVNALMTNMKSDLAVTSLELSCNPDEGEPSSKELRPVKCKDGTVSSDTKKSMESNDSDLDKDILDV